MNLIAKYLARFLRRLSVPHCGDCKYYLQGRCVVNAGWKYGLVSADVMRRRDCGKHGRYFESKENNSE